MDQTERTIISEMFDKLRRAESQNPSRDFQAETFIRERITFQPAAPYYMIQSLVVTEQALANMQSRLEQSQQRIQQLEYELSQRPASGGGGLFGSLFGSKPASTPPTSPPIPSQQYAGQPGYGQPGYGQPQAASQYGDPRVQQYMSPQHQQSGGGGGFMAGALTTAAGVAGGMLIGNAVMGMFEGDENPVAGAADAAQGAVDDAQAQVEEASGGIFGGSLFGGDDEDQGEEI